jgi:hypothetical protein
MAEENYDVRMSWGFALCDRVLAYPISGEVRLLDWREQFIFDGAEAWRV